MTRERYGDVYSNGGYLQTVRFLQAQGVNSDMAREIAQAAWVRGWERHSQLNVEGRVVEWVNSIARNQFVSTLRHERNLCPLSAANDRTVSPAVNLAVIELNHALRMCTNRQQELLENVYVLGYSNSDLAKRSGQSLGSVHSKLSRARRAVRKYMSHAGSNTTVDGTKNGGYHETLWNKP